MRNQNQYLVSYYWINLILIFTNTWPQENECRLGKPLHHFDNDTYTENANKQTHWKYTNCFLVSIYV